MTGTPPAAKHPWWVMVASERGAAALALIWMFQLVLAVWRMAGDGEATSALRWAFLGLCVLMVAGHVPTWVHLRRTRLAPRTGRTRP